MSRQPIKTDPKELIFEKKYDELKAFLDAEKYSVHDLLQYAEYAVENASDLVSDEKIIELIFSKIIPSKINQQAAAVLLYNAWYAMTAKSPDDKLAKYVGDLINIKVFHKPNDVLIAAIRNNNKVAARYLIDNDFDLDFEAADRYWPDTKRGAVHLSISSLFEDDPEIVQMILERRPDLAYKKLGDSSALAEAIGVRRFEVAKAILPHLSTIVASDLLPFVHNNDEATYNFVVENCLLERVEDIDAGCEYLHESVTLLYRAAALLNYDAAKKLLELGADPTLEGGNRGRIISFCEGSFPAMAALFRKYGAYELKDLNKLEAELDKFFSDSQNTHKDYVDKSTTETLVRMNERCQKILGVNFLEEDDSSEFIKKYCEIFLKDLYYAQQQNRSDAVATRVERGVGAINRADVLDLVDVFEKFKDYIETSRYCFEYKHICGFRKLAAMIGAIAQDFAKNNDKDEMMNAYRTLVIKSSRFVCIKGFFDDVVSCISVFDDQKKYPQEDDRLYISPAELIKRDIGEVKSDRFTSKEMTDFVQAGVEEVLESASDEFREKIINLISPAPKIPEELPEGVADENHAQEKREAQEELRERKVTARHLKGMIKENFLKKTPDDQLAMFPSTRRLGHYTVQKMALVLCDNFIDPQKQLFASENEYYAFVKKLNGLQGVDDVLKRKILLQAFAEFEDQIKTDRSLIGELKIIALPFDGLRNVVKPLFDENDEIAYKLKQDQLARAMKKAGVSEAEMKVARKEFRETKKSSDFADKRSREESCVCDDVEGGDKSAKDFEVWDFGFGERGQDGGEAGAAVADPSASQLSPNSQAMQNGGVA